MPIASLICGALALLMAVGAVFTAAMPVIGSIFAFGSPVLALVGIVLGGLGHSRSEDMKGVAVAGLVVSIVAFVLGLLVAMTCGMCNACVTAGAAGTAGAAQGMGGALSNPNNWIPPAPDPGSTPAPPPFPSQPGSQSAAIEDESDPPVPLADVLEHLNRGCHDAWCAPTNREYLFTHVSCNASECALQFTAFHFERDRSGPYQGRVRVPREAIRAGSEPGSIVPEPLDAALSEALESWAPAPGAQLEGTEDPELAFIEWANETCPDSWCEGDIAYQYEHVHCEEEECTIFFRYGDYDSATDRTTWVPGQNSVPRSVVVHDWWDSFDDAQFERFMALTDEFTRAHVQR